MRTALIVVAICLVPSVLIGCVYALIGIAEVRRRRHALDGLDVIDTDDLERLRATHTFSNNTNH